MSKEQTTSVRKLNIEKRHQKITERFNTLYNQRIEGVKLDYSGIILKLSDEFGYSATTIEGIIKKR